MNSDINKTDEQGRKQGHWIEKDDDGRVFEGTYADGKEHGHWVERFAGGNVSEGPMVDGKKHGRWVLRGEVYVTYRNGEVVE